MEKIGIFFLLAILIGNGSASETECVPDGVNIFRYCRDVYDNRCLGFKLGQGGCRTCVCNDQVEKFADLKVNSDEDRNILHRIFNTNYYNEVIKHQADENIQRGAAKVGSGKQYWTIYRDSDGNPLIPYVAAGTGLPQTAQDTIAEAIADFEKRTCLRFVERTTQTDYINFVDRGQGDGCWSNLGRSHSQPNTIHLSPGCQTKGTIEHEILHAIAFYHEQARPDRDDHVIVVEENIQENFEDQFEKLGENEIFSFNSPYDIGSVMQYRSTAFSKNGQYTITDLNGNRLNVQRDGMSDSDVEQVNQLYNCESLLSSTSQAPTTPTPAPTTSTLPMTSTSQSTSMATEPTPPPETSTSPMTSTSSTMTSTMTSTSSTMTSTMTSASSTMTSTMTSTSSTMTSAMTSTTPTSTTEEICMDVLSERRCERKKRRNACLTRPRRMRELCRDTCDLCDCKDSDIEGTCRGVLRKNIPSNPNRKRCYIDVEWAMDNCRLTCKFCNYDPEKDTRCLDLDPRCRRMNYICWVYPEYSSVYCMETCGYCFKKK